MHPFLSTHDQRREFTEKAIEDLQDVHESLNWNTIAHLLEELRRDRFRWWDLVLKYHLSLIRVKSLYGFAFETHLRLKPEIRHFMLEQLRREQRKRLAA